MAEPVYRVSIRIAGNTEIPSLLALQTKGYALKLWRCKSHDDEYLQNFDAEKDGCIFSATTAEELLGLVAMWEVRGDDWQKQRSESNVYQILDDCSVTYDSEGNVIEDD